MNCGSHAQGRRGYAFTLIELLVVVSIIMLLAALLLPALKKAKWNAQRIACVSNLRQLGLGVTMYAGDFAGAMPGENAGLNNHWDAFDANGTVTNPCFASVYQLGYVRSAQVFYCPGFWATGDMDNYMKVFSSPKYGWNGYPWPNNHYLYMGYGWRGGYNRPDNNVSWTESGHVPLSLFEHIVMNTGGGILRHVEVNPAQVSPLIDSEWLDGAGNIELNHPPNGAPTAPAGANHWYLDGHAAWIPDNQLITQVGGWYQMWQSYEPWAP